MDLILLLFLSKKIPVYVQFLFFIKFNKSFSENIFIYSSNNFIFINLLTPFMINAITVSKEDILI